MAKIKKESSETKEVVLSAKVKVIKKYKDMRFNSVMPIGEEFEVSKERAKELVNAGVAEVIQLQ